MSDDTGAGDLIEGIKNAHIEPSLPDDAISSGSDGGTPTSPPVADVVVRVVARDGAGDVFDPAIHVADNLGNPSITKTGRFRKRKTTGKSAPKSSRSAAVPKLNLGADSENDENSDDSAEIFTNTPQSDPLEAQKLRMAAETAANMYIGTGLMIFGMEWQPSPDKSDREMLVIAFEDYFRSKGVVDIPPGIALSLALFSYAVPRLSQPQTSSRIALGWAWVKYRINGAFSRASRDDIRANRERKNETGEDSGQKNPRFWNTRPNS